MKKTNLKSIQARKEEIRMRLNEIENDVAHDVASFADKLNPLKAVSSFVSNAVIKPKSRDLASWGVNVGVDLVVSRMLFRRGGLLGKVVVPFILKNTLKNAINNNRQNIVEGFLKWVIRKTDTHDDPQLRDKEIRVLHVSESLNGVLNVEKERMSSLYLPPNTSLS